MHRPIAFVLSLALAGCGAVSSGPPPLDVFPTPTSSPSATAPPSGFDLRVTDLPARPAGAAFAVAGQEHALVRPPAPAIAPAAPTLVTVEPPLATHVLAVQAAYRRWCEGTALPGDTALLSRTGGIELPGMVACTPRPTTSTSGHPRALIPGES